MPFYWSRVRVGREVPRWALLRLRIKAQCSKIWKKVQHIEKPHCLPQKLKSTLFEIFRMDRRRRPLPLRLKFFQQSLFLPSWGKLRNHL